MNVEIAATDIDEYKADGRGRITLGAEFADESVTVAIIEREP